MGYRVGTDQHHLSNKISQHQNHRRKRLKSKGEKGMKERGNLIREMAEHDRPRERLEFLGAGSLTDAEILAILLRTGGPGVSVLVLAENLLSKFGSLHELSRRSVGEMA